MLVLIDKASNNVAIICKKHYVEVLVNELVKLQKKSETYEEISKDKEKVVAELMKEIQDEFGIETEDEARELSMMYWSPKMHKKPSGARFIIASKCCVTKRAAQCATAMFKVFQYGR